MSPLILGRRSPLLVSGPTTIASDNFNRADGALGTTPVGSKAWTSPALSFGISIVSNQAKADTVSIGGAVIDGATLDYTVSVKLYPVSGEQCGIIYRYADNLNYGRVHWNGSTGEVQIQTIIGGGAAQQNQATTTWAAGDTLTVIIAGTLVTAQKNGGTLCSATVSNGAINGTTKQGIYANGDRSIFDDFLVTT